MQEKHEKITQNDSANGVGEKHQYNTPQVKKFGRVRELTTGGSGNMKENSGADTMVGPLMP